MRSGHIAKTVQNSISEVINLFDIELPVATQNMDVDVVFQVVTI